jgi:glycosyltransferase involved in cell wall biosynthesis
MKRTKVSYYQRRRREGQNFSIEQIFNDLRANLSGSEFDTEINTSKYVSSGLLKRAYNTIEAIFRQGDINHVTGDIHYVSILLKKKKTINTIHDIGFLARSKGFKHWLFKKLWIEWPARRSKLITVVSNSTKQELLKYTTIPENKIRVIPVAISGKFVQGVNKTEGTSLQILQIGSAKNKNLGRLIEAVSGLDVSLEIIGKPQQELLDLMERNKVKYHCSNNLSIDDVVAKYHEADILFFASTYEGFGMPIIEAQTVGLPVITSNTSSMPEVAGDAAIFVDPLSVSEIKNAIKKLSDDDEYRKNLIYLGFQNAKRFSPSIITSKYVAVYREVLEI